VLLFETRAGWDISGGSELLDGSRHPDGRTAILFSDGHVEMRKSGELPKLNWGN